MIRQRYLLTPFGDTDDKKNPAVWLDKTFN